MPQSGFVAAVVLAVSCGTIVASNPAHAQRRTSLTLSSALSTVNFAGIGGRFAAITAQATVGRRVGDAIGVEVNGFALVPGGGATADPACLPSQPCASSSTPSAIVGSLVGPFADLGTSGVRLSAGVGLAHATGGSGFSPRSSGAVSVAVEWRVRPTSRVSPSAGVRLATLAHPVAGARLLLLPGLGVTF